MAVSSDNDSSDWSNRFIELVKREWLDSGHPFSLRHNHVKSAPEKEKAPMFLLFLDSVWQVGGHSVGHQLSLTECIVECCIMYIVLTVFGCMTACAVSVIVSWELCLLLCLQFQ